MTTNDIKPGDELIWDGELCTYRFTTSHHTSVPHVVEYQAYCYLNWLSDRELISAREAWLKANPPKSAFPLPARDTEIKQLRSRLAKVEGEAERLQAMRDAIAPVIAEAKQRADYLHDTWDEGAHVEMTLTIGEIRSLDRAASQQAKSSKEQVPPDLRVSYAETEFCFTILRGGFPLKIEDLKPNDIQRLRSSFERLVAPIEKGIVVLRISVPDSFTHFLLYCPKCREKAVLTRSTGLYRFEGTCECGTRIGIE